jgi:hypothetical protein
VEDKSKLAELLSKYTIRMIAKKNPNEHGSLFPRPGGYILTFT